MMHHCMSGSGAGPVPLLQKNQLNLKKVVAFRLNLWLYCIHAKGLRAAQREGTKMRTTRKYIVTFEFKNSSITTCKMARTKTQALVEAIRDHEHTLLLEKNGFSCSVVQAQSAEVSA